MKYYLAHPFVRRQFVRCWELNAEPKLNVELINPFYDVERKDISKEDIGTVDRYSGDPAAIVDNDVELIQDCNGFIGIVDGSLSYGTIMEIVYAHSCFNVEHVILLVTNGEEKHPWFRYHATHIVTTFTALEELIRKL